MLRITIASLISGVLEAMVDAISICMVTKHLNQQSIAPLTSNEMDPFNVAGL